MSSVEGNDSNRSSRSRSDPFYLDTMVFEVEDKLYRVPRYGFEGRSGGPFEICATLPSNGDVEGRSDDNPISLPVKKNDFESLLKLIYAPNSQDSRNFFGTQPPTSKEEWLGILHLSTMWCFDDIRQQAISNLSTMNLGDSEKVEMGLRFSVSDWVAQGYAGIASNLNLRVTDLDVSQETKLALFIIRDQFFSAQLAELIASPQQLLQAPSYNSYNYHYSQPQPQPLFYTWEAYISSITKARDDLDKIVREVFSDTLASLK